MKHTTPELMPRDKFSVLTLHEKNAYLQELADRFAAANDRAPVVLDKDALSRLRRYYSRRVEPPRLYLRPFGLSYAAMAGASRMA